MTTIRSTANAAQKNLVTRLQLREGLAGVLIQVGLPAEVPVVKERIYVAAIDDLKRAPHPERLALDQGIFHESYTLSLFVECERAGGIDKRQPVTDRLWEIVAEIEQDLADDGELADEVESAYVQAIPLAFTNPEPEGWISKAVVHIHVDALCILA